MPLSIYSATGPLDPVSRGTVRRLPAAAVVGASGVVLNPNNLRDRYVLMRRYTLTVQVQGVPSSGHRVRFINARGEVVSGGVSNALGLVTGIFNSTDPVTALIEDVPGGDTYNTMVRTGLIPVQFDSR